MPQSKPPLQLYNTLTREKAPFVPLDPGHVRMYVCGPTVYDFAHIGNARPVIVFDVLFRLLRYLYGDEQVTYVRNITDVDDKINARALEDCPDLPLNDAIAKVTRDTTKQFHTDVAALGCLEPTHEPRATDNIEQMKEMIQSLIAKGHAYEAAGEVLFDTASMADYGKLSNRNLAEQQAGARVDVEEHKRNAADFVLWKSSSEKEPGWESPWGRGRPGWHIECSAMSNRYLWDAVKDDLSDEARAQLHQFDIHGGGLDLIFPHHENEIAQSRCAHGSDAMARVWMHNGFLQVEGEKMSKSLGNFVTIHKLLTDWRGSAWPGAVIRMAMLQTHYRRPLDFSENALERASIALSNFKSFSFYSAEVAPSEEFIAALCDDLNTPRAIAELHRLEKASRAEIANTADNADASTPGGTPIVNDRYFAARQLASCLAFVGIDIENFDSDWDSRSLATSTSDEEIEELIEARHVARKAKDWAKSDEIRDQLAAMGIQLKDSKNPETGEIETKWKAKD